MERSGGDGDGFGEVDQGRGILRGGVRNGTARHIDGHSRCTRKKGITQILGG